MNRVAAREKAKALVAQMTLEEKMSQLRYDAPNIACTNTFLTGCDSLSRWNLSTCKVWF